MALLICPQCQSQHGDEVTSCPSCGLQVPPSALPTPVPSRAYPEAHLAGQVIGKYKMEKLVGRGGMACVYLATRLDLQMPVAVKIVSPQIVAEDDFAQRFLREARIQFSLQHPGIVRVFDLIQDDGWLGMSMDWIQGASLQTWLKNQELPVAASTISGIFIAVLDAIAYAHQQKVLHRDIKPANILLHQAGGRIQPKLTDFGIAKMLDGGSQMETLSHLSLGTPTYMSPEQIEGARDIDHRSDIYSLGVLLFRMASGVPPFKRSNAMGTSLAHLHDPVPSVAQKCPGADTRFDPVIRKAMAKKPEHRFQDCYTFAVALKHAIGDPRPLPPTLQSLGTPQATAVALDVSWMSQVSDPEEQGLTEISGSQSWGLGDVQEPSPSSNLSQADPQGYTAELIRQSRGRSGYSPLSMALIGGISALVVVAVGWFFFLRSPEPVFLTLTAKPKQAVISVDGEPFGTTPAKIPASQGQKPRRVRIELSGYVTQNITWAGKKARRIDVVLTPYVSFQLLSNPAGAKVFVDGKLVGQTPYLLQLPQGKSVQIRLTKEGRVDKQISYTATSDEKRVLHLAPKLF